MPVITLESAQLNQKQKELLIKELTATASKIMNIPEQSYYVFLNTHDMDNIGAGGKLLADFLNESN